MDSFFGYRVWFDVLGVRGCGALMEIPRDIVGPQLTGSFFLPGQQPDTRSFQSPFRLG